MDSNPGFIPRSILCIFTAGTGVFWTCTLVLAAVPCRRMVSLGFGVLPRLQFELSTLLRMNCDGFHRSILNTRILLESIPSFELFFNALFYLGRTSSNIVNALSIFVFTVYGIIHFQLNPSLSRIPRIEGCGMGRV